MVRVLVENNRGVMEWRWWNDGWNGMGRSADVEGCSCKLMVCMVMLLLLVMVLMGHRMWPLMISQLFARAWCRCFPCCWSLCYPYLQQTTPLWSSLLASPFSASLHFALVLFSLFIFFFSICQLGYLFQFNLALLVGKQALVSWQC